MYVQPGFYLDWKTLKNGKVFSSQGKPGNFEQTGKVRENQTKYWKIERISDKCYLLLIVIAK